MLICRALFKWQKVPHFPPSLRWYVWLWAHLLNNLTYRLLIIYWYSLSFIACRWRGSLSSDFAVTLCSFIETWVSSVQSIIAQLYRKIVKLQAYVLQVSVSLTKRRPLNLIINSSLVGLEFRPSTLNRMIKMSFLLFLNLLYFICLKI